MIARLLNKVAQWALAKNKPGGYSGEDDKRWAYTIETDGSPYLTRILLPRIKIPFTNIEFRPMLHNFHRPDDDRNPHNHPWNWAASFILSGSYTEERVEAMLPPPLEPVMVRRVVKWFNRLNDSDYHNVLELHGDVWTLFITGKRVQDWGFLSQGKHVPWRDYLGVKSS